MRGLIVDPFMSINGDALSISSPGDSQLIRSWVLYWDKFCRVDVPGMIGFGSYGPDLNYLENRGVFSILDYHHPGGKVASVFLEARNNVFKKLEAAEPGVWSVGCELGDIAPSQYEVGRALQVSLIKSLPIPNQDVPLEDILEFRSRRIDECEELMFYIDQSYQSVLASPDKPLAEHDALERIARSARQQLEVIKEQKMPFRLADLVVDFNMAAAAITGIGSVTLGVSWPGIIGNSLLAGATFSFSHVLGVKNPKKNDSPFKYIVSYHDEFFRP